MKNTKDTCNTLSSDDILRRLLALHADELCIPECKIGSTLLSSSEPLRMDLWCMARSWSPKRVTAYEIKVSRADWLSDQKWHRYLPYCHRMLVVCPPGVVLPNEVADGAGLLYTTSGTRLKTIVKPMHRDVTIPENLWFYLCMHRLRPGAPSTESPKELWLDWLRQKEENREIGHRVRGAIAKRHLQLVTAVQQKQRELERENQELQVVKQFLVDMKLHPNMDLRIGSGQSANHHIRKMLLELLPDVEQRSRDILGTLRRMIPEARMLQDSLTGWMQRVEEEKKKLEESYKNETPIT